MSPAVSVSAPNVAQFPRTTLARSLLLGPHLLDGFVIRYEA